MCHIYTYCYNNNLRVSIHNNNNIVITLNYDTMSQQFDNIVFTHNFSTLWTLESQQIANMLLTSPHSIFRGLSNLSLDFILLVYLCNNTYNPYIFFLYPFHINYLHFNLYVISITYISVSYTHLTLPTNREV